VLQVNENAKWKNKTPQAQFTQPSSSLAFEGAWVGSVRIVPASFWAWQTALASTGQSYYVTSSQPHLLLHTRFMSANLLRQRFLALLERLCRSSQACYNGHATMGWRGVKKERGSLSLARNHGVRSYISSKLQGRCQRRRGS
jgi:hypothetical protein